MQYKLPYFSLRWLCDYRVLQWFCRKSLLKITITFQVVPFANQQLINPINSCTMLQSHHQKRVSDIPLNINTSCSLQGTTNQPFIRCIESNSLIKNRLFIQNSVENFAQPSKEYGIKKVATQQVNFHIFCTMCNIYCFQFKKQR